MNEEHLFQLVGMLAKIAYKMADDEGIDPELKEMLLELWREYDRYNHFN